MKQKKWLIPICAIAGVLLLCGAFLWYLKANSLTLSVGRFLRTDNGFCMLVDEHGPIRLSNTEGKSTLCDGLASGDKILVLRGTFVRDSLPGQTWARAVFKLSGGTVSDIPEAVLTQLAALGMQPVQS